MRLKPEYVAGLFDGEGCVLICQENRRGKSTFRLRAVLANNHLILSLIQECYGGYLQYKPHNNHLTWDSKQAADFLLKIHPWTIIKRPQIELALAFSNRIQRSNNRSLTDDELEERLWFKQEISRINQLGGRSDPIV